MIMLFNPVAISRLGKVLIRAKTSNCWVAINQFII